MKAAVVFCGLLAVIFAATPTRPNIAETFQARGEFKITDKNSTFTGEAYLGINQPHGLGIENYKIHGHPRFDRFFLQRFDLNESFAMEGANEHICQKHKTTGTMPKFWGWVQEASYTGKVNGLEVWSLHRGYAVVSIGVHPENPNVPVYYSRKTPDTLVELNYHKFEHVAPHTSKFEIPHSCSKATLESPIRAKRCENRDGMISRAKVWVQNHVPYNQGAHYDGYREDCSGYVSMAWELSKPGYVTSTLPQVAHRISKDDLQKGDVLLNVAEHVVLFGGWADGGRTHYISFEETRPGEGTVTRVTPYPYWYETSSFVPYRYNNAC